MPARSVHHALRKAATTMEMLVAISLLAFAVTGMGQFVRQVNSGLRDRELSARIGWELLNARERIGTWPKERLTVEQIQKLPVSAALAESLEEAQFTASIVTIATPIRATQITLALECKVLGQPAQPAVLTFWVAAEGDGDS